MRILYIYPELTIKGGADKVIIDKANYLSTHGYEVIIVTESQMGRDIIFPLLSSVRHIDMSLDFNKQYTQNIIRRFFTYFSFMRKYKSQLRAVINKEKPDIIITTIGRSIDFLADLNVGGIKIAEAHTTKNHLRSLHLMEEKGGLYKFLAGYLRRTICRKVSKLDALVVLTQNDADDWKEAKRVVVIPNSVPMYSSANSSLTNKQAIMVGRYNDAKGYDYLIPAWSLVHQKHPDWVLNVYGSGELHDQVIQWINDYQLEETIILHEPTDNIMEKYLESSICVLSSRYEGFSMVIAEAMSCGVPCVSFDCPHGPRTIIANGEDGLLVEYLNTKALADGICKLIEDENLRIQFGCRAKQNIQRYSQEKVMGQWHQLFKSLKNDEITK